MTRYHGLTKLAQLKQAQPIFARALDGIEGLENSNGLTRHLGKTIRSMNPGLALFSNQGLDSWERVRDAHPVASFLSSLVPVAGAVPMYADAASDARRGHYGSALANTVFGTMGLVGGGALAKALAGAGRMAMAAKGVKGVAPLMKAPGAGTRILSRLRGVPAPDFVESRMSRLLSKAPGVRGMSMSGVRGLEGYGDAMARLMPNKVMVPGMAAAAGGIVYDGMQTGREQAQALRNVPAGMAQSYYNLLNR